MSLYAVMIVDDERLIRDGLKESIPWEQFGMSVAATATDGTEALETFELVRPQIIIMDIKMPEMDGLLALELIKARNTDTEVVLLSGYDEFTYAKRGIRLGAFDYVLKINVFHELEGVLSRLRQRLDEKQDRSCSLAQLQQLRSNYAFLQCIRGKTPAGIVLSTDKTMYSVVSVWIEKEEMDLSARIATVMSDSLFVIGAESHYVHMILYQEGDDAAAYAQLVANKLEALDDYLRNELDGVPYVVGAGGMKRVVADLPNSYQEAMKAIDYLRSNADSNSKLMYAEWASTALGVHCRLSESSEAWVNWVFSGDEERLLAWISELFKQAYVMKDFPLKQVQTLCIQLLFQFESVLRFSEQYRGNISNFFDEMKEYHSLHELEQYMILHCKRLCRLVHENMQMEKIKSITLVKEYIDQMYTTSSLSLSDVAEHFHFSSGYLSLRFKEYTGKTFSQYVIHKRLTRSCELLAGTNLQIYKIAEQVGYTDDKHFTKLFLKNLRMSPRDYRMKHQQK